MNLSAIDVFALPLSAPGRRLSEREVAQLEAITLRANESMPHGKDTALAAAGQGAFVPANGQAAGKAAAR